MRSNHDATDWLTLLAFVVVSIAGCTALQLYAQDAYATILLATTLFALGMIGRRERKGKRR